MAIRKYVRIGNTPALHSEYFNSTSNIRAKTVSVNADRYKIIIPPTQLDIGGDSYQLQIEREISLNSDTSWDFGQSIGTWTANTEYSVGDWVRPTSGSSIWDGANNSSVVNFVPQTADGVHEVSGFSLTATSNYNGNNAVDNIFDRKALTYYPWMSSSSSSPPHAVMIKFPVATVINKYNIANRDDYFLNTWSIQASNDSSVAVGNTIDDPRWTNLHTITDTNYTINAWRGYFTFFNATPYLFYRIYISSTNHATYASIVEMSLVAQPQCAYKCTSAGTSLSSEPTWGTTVGGTTVESGGPTWTCYYDYTSATNRAGTDFYIYACQPTSGTTPTFLLSANSTYPHGYTASNSRKIGGFHGLCGSVGTISTHLLSGYLTGDILPYSVWDLKHRSSSTTNSGLVYIPPIDKWCAIYLTSGSSSEPTIMFGGTILNNLTWYVGNNAARLLKMRFPSDSEFAILAFNSNEATNILGSTNPITVTAAVNTAGRRMISDYGVEGCAGQMWQWLVDTSYLYDTDTNWTWKNQTNTKGQLFTQGTYGYVKSVSGGMYSSGVNAGSLSRSYYRWIWTSNAEISLRFIANNIEK